MIEFVELEVARAAKGVRMVVNGAVPSPWSEAAKAVFRLARIPVTAVRHRGDLAAINAWTGTDNAPVVLHEREPARTAAAAIVALAARLSPGTVLPADPGARSDIMGAIEMIAGEDGIGWNARLAMIHNGLTTEGARGFPLRVAAYLAPRYGYSAEGAPGVVDRFRAQLAVLRDKLGTADYFGGAAPNALDAYVATFLTIVTPFDTAACPNIVPALHAAFASGAVELGPLVPGTLVALRTRMFERHLAFPIEL